MVATERIKRSETEEELQEVRLEKDALQEALRLIESENGQLRSTQLFTGRASDRTAPQSSSKSRSSSRYAVKSPLPSSLSPSPPNSDDVVAPSGLTLSTASFVADNPDYLADFILQPAPKAPFVASHQTPPSKMQVISDVPSDSLSSAPEFVSRTSAPFIPDEPSPWADASS